MKSLKSLYAIFAAINVISLVIVVFAFFKYADVQNEVRAAQEKRFKSYLVADEIRQSSDDLTRLGRTYVVTKNSLFLDQYNSILAIRSGKAPRPDDYNRIYWDFVSAGTKKPRPDGETIAVRDIMKRLGFTQEEFSKLDESVANSDGLVKLEVEAMNLVEGKDATGHALANPNPESDRMKAIGMLHSSEYHREKAGIMKPMDEFFVLMQQRINLADKETASASGFYFQMLSAALAFCGLSIVALLVFSFGRVVRPITRMTRFMNVLAAGDTAAEVPDQTRTDEIGTMAAAVQVFKNNLIHSRQLEIDSAQARLAADEQRKAGMRQMVETFELTVGDVIGTVSTEVTLLQATAQTMSAMATATAGQSTTVASAAEEAASNVNTVSAAAEELGSSVQEIGRQVSGSAELARLAVGEAKQTGVLVQELNSAVTRIGDVVVLISNIAGQTNLLALNATIEAARAGTAGKGFAVVAAEVKALAEQTAKATSEISGQIDRIQGVTGQAVGAIGAITLRISEISGVATSIAAAVEEQGAATQEIVRNVSQAAMGTGEVTSNISGLAGAAEETGVAANQVLGAASKLSRQAEHLSAEVDRFLSSVRAA